MSPRTKEQNEEIRLQRVREIMKAAVDVYLEQGITMEMRDIAAKAGLGYGTVYHYYKNKLMLLEDLLWLAFEEARLLTNKAIAADGDSRQRLRRYTSMLLGHWFYDRSTYILYKMIWENFHQVPGGRFQMLYDRFQTDLHEPLVRVVQEALGGMEPESKANLLLGSMIGCAGLWIHHGHDEPDTDQMAASLLAGVLGKELL
ncbi:TetR/AcrR family transcriptional regulator [Paenibacillus sp. y28]|uniref:TetR/AcrR family transcriptional regulator n=1 Tax=Paenibacillus sp. y28 TaxID=3129110 RepID=UPI003019DE12